MIILIIQKGCARSKSIVIFRQVNVWKYKFKDVGILKNAIHLKKSIYANNFKNFLKLKNQCEQAVG